MWTSFLSGEKQTTTRIALKYATGNSSVNILWFYPGNTAGGKLAVSPELIAQNDWGSDSLTLWVTTYYT